MGLRLEGLTVGTRVRTWIGFIDLLINFITRGDSQGETRGSGKLGVTAALVSMLPARFPFFQGADLQVLSKKDIESGVDIGKRFVTHKDHSIELF